MKKKTAVQSCHCHIREFNGPGPAVNAMGMGAVLSQIKDGKVLILMGRAAFEGHSAITALHIGSCWR